jgi:hypothetical protein
MTTFAPTALPHIAPADPSKHVNYQLGMVLGVDDFQAEFTYLSDRARRIVRDLVGYGVVSGLHVTVGTEIDERGPRLQVSPGGLVTASGQLVCVSPAQCAYVNEWLRANRQGIDVLPTPPPLDLKLAVVACYRECETDDVPIPGEPCRSEDELMKPSRMQDSFALELRFDAPPQAEDDAVRDFVRWIRRIAVVDSPPGDVALFVAELEKATAEVETKPPDPLAFLDSPPPPALVIPRAAWTQYLETLLAFWVTRLRARARSGPNTAECGCCGGPGELDPGAECLQVAQISVPVAIEPFSGDILVVDATKIAIDETRRPHLLHLRLVQELMLAANGPPAKPPVSGFVTSDGKVERAAAGLQARFLDKGLFLLSYPGFDPKERQLVWGQPVGFLKEPQARTFEVLSASDGDLAALLATLPDPPSVEDGIVVRLRTAAGDPAEGGFSVRIDASEGTP